MGFCLWTMRPFVWLSLVESQRGYRSCLQRSRVCSDARQHMLGTVMHVHTQHTQRPSATTRVFVHCTKQEQEYCEQISPQLFENTMHTLLRVLRDSQGKWDAREQRGVAAYARGLQLLLSGYGKDIHEVPYARSMVKGGERLSVWFRCGWGVS